MGRTAGSVGSVRRETNWDGVPDALASNYLKAINFSGTLTVADKGLANARLTQALPAP
jgi:hypothetical protein